MQVITTSDVLRTVMAIAARHEQVINSSMLADAGASWDWVAHKRRSGLLLPADRRVFTVGLLPGELPRRTCEMVGVLSTAETSGLLGPTAMARLGLWEREDGTIHVGSSAFNHRVITGLAPELTVELHRSDWMTSERVEFDGTMPIADPLYGIATLGRHLEWYQITYIIYRAVYRRVITADELGRLLPTLPNTPWTRKARIALKWFLRGSVGTKSKSEDHMTWFLDRHGIPEPLINVIGATGHAGLRLDFVWPERRVVLEIDGGHHVDIPGVANNDEEVDRMLNRDGWIVIRFHYVDVWQRPYDILAAVSRALGC